jgi:hypothetical protein
MNIDDDAAPGLTLSGSMCMCYRHISEQSKRLDSPFYPLANNTDASLCSTAVVLFLVLHEKSLDLGKVGAHKADTKL